MSAWRAAGLNYINYSTIAARIVRQCLKGPAKVDAAKRSDSTIKFQNWEGGKPQIREEAVPK